MKTLFLVPHLKISGGMRIILTYADLLSRRGNDVSVVIEQRNTFRRIVSNILRKKPNWFPALHAKILRVRSLEEEFLHSADIIVAGNYDIALRVGQFSEKAGAPFYFIQHDEGMYHGGRSLVERAIALHSKKLVVSTWLQELLRDKYGQPSRLLFNPTDRILFHPLPKEPHAEVRVLLLDHTYEWKGTKEGIEVVKELKKKYPNIRLLGFGARRKNAGTDFDEYYYNLPQEKLAWLYSRADIFLCPSWDEGFGLPSVEAMQCKTAVVTYDNGGSRDFAFDGKTALVAERRNMAQLKEKLEALVKNSQLRDTIAKQGYEFVQTMPTQDEQTARFEEIFQEALLKS